MREYRAPGYSTRSLRGIRELSDLQRGEGQSQKMKPLWADPFFSPLTDARDRLARQFFDLFGQPVRLLLQFGAFRFQQLPSFRRQVIQHAVFLLAKLARLVIGT